MDPPETEEPVPRTMQSSLRGFPSLENRPLATSSPMSNAEVQHLKMLMQSEGYGKSFSGSEPSAIGQELATTPSDGHSSSSEKEEIAGILKKKVQELPVAEGKSPIEPAKDIKVYQSGGTFILQNFKNLPDAADKKAISEISSKLIEDCHKLTETLKEEPKEKVVQFDLTRPEVMGPSTPEKGSHMDSSFRSREPSSLSTNESLSYQPASISSPASSLGGPRLEWDSLGDVGYLDIDISKENLSTLERLTLQGLPKRGSKTEKKVVYKTSRGDKVLERIPSDLVEQDEKKTPTMRDTATSPPPPTTPEESTLKEKITSDCDTQTQEDITFKEPKSEASSLSLKGNSKVSKERKIKRSPQRRRLSPSSLSLKEKSSKSLKPKTAKKTEEESSNDGKRSPIRRASPSSGLAPKGPSSKNPSTCYESPPDERRPASTSDFTLKGLSSNSSKKSGDEVSCECDSENNDEKPAMRDMSTSVNTLGDEFSFHKISYESSEHGAEVSPRTKKLKKKRELASQNRKLFKAKETIQEVIDMGVELSKKAKDDGRDDSNRPVSVSSIGSVLTVIPSVPSVEEKTVQTSERELVSKSVQVGEEVKRKISKSIQASGELNSLPKHLDAQRMADMTGGEVRTKSTQFFGAGVNSLPKALTNVERTKKVTEKSSDERQKSGMKQKKSSEVAGPSGLTEEVLKRRKETVDPRILQEKFFESQKEMVSKSTSMDVRRVVSAGTSPVSRNVVDKSQQMSQNSSMARPAAEDLPGPSEVPKEMITVGVQYSIDESSLNSTRKTQRDEEASREAWSDTADSQASSTQTAHSWVAAGRPGVPAAHKVVRNTRSFEYLPGEVYESSGNLREKLPSETSQNVITESESSVESEPSLVRPESEGGGVELDLSGRTLVVEGSNSASTAGPWLVLACDDRNVQVIKRPVIVEEAQQATNSESTFEPRASQGNSRPSSKTPPKQNSVESKSSHTASIKIKVPKELSESNDSVKSRYSAAVQTESPGISSRRDEQLYRLVQNAVLQVLSSNRSQRRVASEAHSLQKSAQSSLKTSKSSASNFSQTNGTGENDSVLTNDVRESNTQQRLARASSTPIVQKSVDSLGEMISSVTDPESEVPANPLRVDQYTQFSARGGNSIPRICDACKAKRTDQATQMSLRNVCEKPSCQISEVQCECGRTECQCSKRSCKSGSNAEAREESHALNDLILERGLERTSAKNHINCSCGKRNCQCKNTPSVCKECMRYPCQCLPISIRSSDRSVCPKCNMAACKCYENPCAKCKKMGCECASMTSDRSSLTEQCRKCKKTTCVCASVSSVRSSLIEVCRKCKKTTCICASVLSDYSSIAEVCKKCKKSVCECQQKVAKRREGEKKKIQGTAYRDVMNEEPSSSEMTSSKSSQDCNKENQLCRVCHCADVQRCVFCSCHIDKNFHIPKCECHKRSPRHIFPGFCKCHQRNLRCFGKCKCRSDDVITEGNCPCCQYFTSRMRANLIAAQLEGTQAPKREPLPPPTPKQYFLKLEETDVSKTSTVDSEPERRPLEVVTIKIPVKRMGKAKVPTRQFYYGGEVERPATAGSAEKEIEYLEDIVQKYQSKIASGRSLPTETTRSSTERPRTVSRAATSYRSLQECLMSNRPDFMSSAEYRRHVILERAKERELRQKGLPPRPPPPVENRRPNIEVPPRMFTTSEIRAQSRKKCKTLQEVTSKKEDRKRMENYRTNRLNAEIFAKRLQIKALRGQLDISNSCNLLAT